MAVSSTVIACDLELEGFDVLKNVLNPTRFMAALRKNVRQANKRLALTAQDILTQSINTAKSWSVPNALATIAKKGSTHPLVDRGDLLGNAHSTLIGAFQFVVGTNRVDRSGQYNLAWILHQGAHISTGSKVIIIPARPFLKRAFVDNKAFMGMCSIAWREALDKSFKDGGKPTKGKGKHGGGKRKGGGRSGYEFKTGGAGGGGTWVKK